jgi:hypothetical protein
MNQKPLSVRVGMNEAGRLRLLDEKQLLSQSPGRSQD